MPLTIPEVSVDLFLYARRGEMLPLVPPEVCILPEIPAYAHIESPLKDAFLHGHIRVGLRTPARESPRRRAPRQSHSRKRPHGHFLLHRPLRHPSPSPVTDRVYDPAVSFLTPHDIVLSKVRAHKKSAGSTPTTPASPSTLLSSFRCSRPMTISSPSRLT